MSATIIWFGAVVVAYIAAKEGYRCGLHDGLKKNFEDRRKP